jgi:hypothetical protein
MTTTQEHQSRIATNWAAATLTSRGCVLHALRAGWDIELPDGSWRAANDWRELCQVAREVLALDLAYAAIKKATS